MTPFMVFQLCRRGGKTNSPYTTAQTAPGERGNLGQAYILPRRAHFQE